MSGVTFLEAGAGITLSVVVPTKGRAGVAHVDLIGGDWYCTACWQRGVPVDTCWHVQQVLAALKAATS